MDDQPVDAVEVRHNPWMVGLATAPIALAPLMLMLAAITGEAVFAVPNCDGVEVRGAGGRTQVVLRLRGGEEVALHRSGPSFDTTLLASRLRDARDARQRAGLAPAALVRGEQSHASWIAALRKPDAASLRTPVPLKEDYWRVLEDVSAEPLTRGAAAIALGKDLNETERARLERAKKTIAAPKLRVVLDRSADEDEEVLAEMLQALDAKKRT